VRFLKSIRYPTGDFCDLSEIRPVNDRLTAHDSIFLIEEQGPFDSFWSFFRIFFFRALSSSNPFTSRQLVIRTAVPRRH
jgi:hypothetical protein